MRTFSEFKRAVARRETPLYAFLHDVARKVMGFSVPVIPGLHRFLYHEWAERTSLWHNFWRVAYYEPMFKSVCKEVGPGFKMWYAGNGVARILGKIDIYLGKNVTMFDNIGIAGLKIFDNPQLCIGDNVYIGPLCRFNVAKRIEIGRYSIVGSRIMFVDNSGHPVSDAAQRLSPGGGIPRLESVKPIVVGAITFLGAGSYVYPGAQVGDGVVAKVGTHIAGEIPPFCLIEGNPCRVVGKLPISEVLKDHFGEDRYRLWQSQRDAAGL